MGSRVAVTCFVEECALHIIEHVCYLLDILLLIGRDALNAFCIPADIPAVTKIGNRAHFETYREDVLTNDVIRKPRWFYISCV